MGELDFHFLPIILLLFIGVLGELALCLAFGLIIFFAGLAGLLGEVSLTSLKTDLIRSFSSFVFFAMLLGTSGISFLMTLVMKKTVN